MKLITAKMHITRDMLLSSTFDVERTVEQEILARLREVYEETVGHSVGNVVWDIIKGNVVECTTILFEGDVWQIKAQMMIPERFELFKESKDV